MGEAKRAFIEGHFRGTGYAGWWIESATDEERMRQAEDDWEDRATPAADDKPVAKEVRRE